MTGTSGYFSDPSGDNDYSSELDCQWLISAPSNVTSISFRFTEFDTEYNYDFVRIFKGNSTSGTRFGSFSGSGIPSDTAVSGLCVIHRFSYKVTILLGNEALLVFTSDKYVEGAGWTVTYSSTFS